jgi:hypothetical protein
MKRIIKGLEIFHGLYIYIYIYICVYTCIDGVLYIQHYLSLKYTFLPVFSKGNEAVERSSLVCPWKESGIEKSELRHLEKEAILHLPPLTLWSILFLSVVVASCPSCSCSSSSSSSQSSSSSSGAS